MLLLFFVVLFNYTCISYLYQNDVIAKLDHVAQGNKQILVGFEKFSGARHDKTKNTTAIRIENHIANATKSFSVRQIYHFFAF